MIPFYITELNAQCQKMPRATNHALSRSKQFHVVTNNVRPTEKTKRGKRKARNNGKAILFTPDGRTAITCWDNNLKKFYDEDDAEYIVPIAHMSTKARKQYDF